jgi:iron(III) transport system permease protein
MAGAATLAARPVSGFGRDELIQRLAVALLIAWLAVTVLLPLAVLLAKSFQDTSGKWVGLANYVRYFSAADMWELRIRDVGIVSLPRPLWNSLFVGAITTAVVLPLAFVYAYALTRSRMPMKGFFQAVSLVPILAPSLLPAIALVYLFGNQGIFKSWFPDGAIYGWPGIVISQVFYCFPRRTSGSTRRPVRSAPSAGASSGPSRCRARATASSAPRSSSSRWSSPISASPR